MDNLFKSDPLLEGLHNDKSQLIDEYRRRIDIQTSRQGLWDSIDAEVASLSEESKQSLLSSDAYIELNTELMSLVNSVILGIVKPKIESMDKGRELLSKMSDIVSSHKKSSEARQNEELILFRKWKQYSKDNPTATYDEFIKTL